MKEDLENEGQYTDQTENKKDVSQFISDSS